jgi:hypothetical protein
VDPHLFQATLGQHRHGFFFLLAELHAVNLSGASRASVSTITIPVPVLSIANRRRKGIKARACRN